MISLFFCLESTHVSYAKFMLTLKMKVTELNPSWLVEIAPHYYQLKDVEDGISFSCLIPSVNHNFASLWQNHFINIINTFQVHPKNCQKQLDELQRKDFITCHDVGYYHVSTSPCVKKNL